jgi:hypothetical protein
MTDIGPHPTPDYLDTVFKRYRAGTDATGRGKLLKLIARRKKAGRNVKPLLRKLATWPKVTPADEL